MIYDISNNKCYTIHEVITLKFSTRGRYALRLMIDLAQNRHDGKIPLRDISKRQDISIKYLEQIVTPLTHPA